MNKWRLTPAARRDLVVIWNYTAERWGVDQAEDYVGNIRAVLSDAASGTPLIQRIDEVRSDYFRIRTRRHLCYFKRLANDDIQVIRILHERMDVKGRL